MDLAGMLGALGFVISILALCVSWLIRRDQRVSAAVILWTSTQELRFELREHLPYEGDQDKVAEYMVGIDDRPHDRYWLLRYLSLFDAIAAGVNHGALDFRTIRGLDGPRIVEIWDSYSEWITKRANTYRKPIYVELKALAQRMRANPR